MSAERTLEVIQQQVGGRITLGSLVEKLQAETTEERLADDRKPLHVSQVQRWIGQLERDGDVQVTYLRRRGRPLEVAARVYQCWDCEGTGEHLSIEQTCEVCGGAGMVAR